VRQILLIALYTTVFLGSAAGVVRSAPKAGDTLAVRALKAPLMRSPRFFGPTVARLKRGARLQVVAVRGVWYRVKTGGKTGWIHKNRVTHKAIKLSNVRTSGGTARGEAELAGRGFNPQVEQRFRSQHSALDYKHVDRIEQGTVPPANVAKFMRIGGLQLRSGGKK
jgi:hypothetical protein